ncbi:MAG: alpha/beta hydrolase [Nitrososphaeraceae archaeon]|nr:alpha/beta hydrolase [Nitrososphaeraceae archaeon]
MLLNIRKKMHYPQKSKGNNTSVFIIIFMFIMIISTTTVIIMTTTTNHVYGQQDNTNFNAIDSSNIQSIPAKKIQIGDIEISYKMLGKGDHIILFNGASDVMDAWDLSFLTNLSSNHTVIVFDSRGLGNTTMGSKSYSMQQLASDAAGLLGALNIPKADVMGYSLGSFIAQQFTMMYPDKVNTLTLVGSSCGGKDQIPKPAEFIKLQSEVVNKSLNNVSISQEEMKELVAASVGVGWIKLHPEVLDNIPTMQQAKPGLSPEAMNNQNNIGKEWEATNWSGACDELAKLAKPTLVITGTDDNMYVPHVNSLKIVEKIPGAWLVQIKNAGHAVMDQYPEEIGKIMNTFLSTAAQSN